MIDLDRSQSSQQTANRMRAKFCQKRTIFCQMFFSHESVFNVNSEKNHFQLKKQITTEIEDVVFSTRSVGNWKIVT